ncbi:MAG: hypothetical protein E7583_10385 [Ruminococcaceae bacterium]|nr:hypothetical protein [Oscillospiraceae bacterium]
MKKLIAISLAALFAVTAISCEKKEEQKEPENKEVASITYEPAEKPEEKEKVIVEIEELDESTLSQPDELAVNYLDEMEGYWVRTEGYDTGIASFLVESDKGTWTPYYDGTAGQALACKGDVDGIHLENAEGNTVSYAFDGIALLDSEGNVAYIRTDDIPQ